VTVGANGVNLPALTAACVSGQTPVACALAINAATAYLNSGEVPAQLGALLAGIADRSPRATVVVTGYPIPFVPGAPTTDAVNQLAEALNTQLGGTALAAAATGADVVWAPVDFGAHRVGSPDPYLGADPTDPVTFLHPTPDGYVVYRDAVLTAIG
jgi:hypothetical protein